MEIKEFERAIDHETQWLKYYANSNSKVLLTTETENIYDTLKSIGYTKRVLPLDMRCKYCTVTSNKKIDKDVDITDLFSIGEGRDSKNNKFTPLEIFWMKYPEKRQYIINLIS